MGDTVFGLPVATVENTGLHKPVAFPNMFNDPNGRALYMPNGLNPDGTVACPDGTKYPVSALNYLNNKRTVIERSAQQRPLVRLADKNLNIVGELTGELMMDFEELMSDSGTARYVIRYDNWLVDYMVNLTRVEEDLHLIIDPNPLKPNWRTRWGGKIHTINVQRHEDGTSTVELLAIANREHAKKLLFGANPFFPPEIQIPKMWILPGPTRSVLFLSCFVNLARLFVPGLSFITNVFNPASWVNPLNQDSLHNIDPFSWPIQVAFVNPITDTSRWTVLGAAWTSWVDATGDILRDSGVIMRCYTWLTEDEDSPYDELTDLFSQSKVEQVSSSFARPTRNCVIFRFEDKSGHQGPTGTAFDGLLDVIGVTLDDLLSTTLINAGTGVALDGEPVVDVQGNSIPVFESLLGVAPEVPKVIWREGQFTGLIEATHTLNKGSPRTIMTGSRSPSLVNELQTFAIKYGLSQLSDLINVALGTFVNTAFQLPGTVGLENLYQGQLDNTLFAWERLTDPGRALGGGELDYQEVFERGSATAYTLAGILTLRTGLFKTRAFQGFKARVFNGRPWSIDVDTVLGDRNGFEFDSIIFVDQITGVKRSVDRSKALLVELKIGDDKDKFDPLGRTMRAVQAVYQLLGTVVGEGTLFG